MGYEFKENADSCSTRGTPLKSSCGLDISSDRVTFCSIDANGGIRTQQAQLPVSWFDAHASAEYFSSLRASLAGVIPDQIAGDLTVSVPDPWLVWRNIGLGKRDLETCGQPEKTIEQYIPWQLRDVHYGLQLHPSVGEKAVLVAFRKDLLESVLSSIPLRLNLKIDRVLPRAFALLEVADKKMLSKECAILHSEERMGFCLTLKEGLPDFFDARHFSECDLRELANNTAQFYKKFFGSGTKLYVSGSRATTSEARDEIGMRCGAFPEIVPLISIAERMSKQPIQSGDSVIALGLALHSTSPRRSDSLLELFAGNHPTFRTSRTRYQVGDLKASIGSPMR